jgi:streptogramin lyase
MQEFGQGITPSADPDYMAAGPDNNVWFTEGNTHNVARITPTGTVTEFSDGATASSTDIGPRTIITGPNTDDPNHADTTLWFSVNAGVNQPPNPEVAEMTTAGVVTHVFPLPVGTQPGLVLGPDNNVWFTEYWNAAIGRITPDGTVTQFPLPNVAGADIVVGPDGNLWFDSGSSPAENFLGRITTAGDVTIFTYPNVGILRGLAVGPDGNLWAGDPRMNQIDRINPTGQITTFAIPTPGGGPYSVVKGPDGALWFTEPNVSQIGRITTDGSITEYPTPTSNSGPTILTVGPDGNLWFTEQYPNQIGEIVLSGQTQPLPVAPRTAIPGASQAFDLGTFSESGSTDTSWTVTVDWGDQTTPTTFSVTSTGAVGTQAHTYASQGLYTVTETITGNTGDSATTQFQVVVGPVVVNTRDSGPGSLRQAIDEVNTVPSLTAGGTVQAHVTFDIPTSDPGYSPSTGAFTIQTFSPLPDVTAPVVIDGYSQPGASPNTLATGDNAVWDIALDGGTGGASFDGLTIAGGNSTVQGLRIENFSKGIHLTSSNNVVAGNIIENPDWSFGVYAEDASSNTIGGTTPAARNLLSGGGRGIAILGFSATSTSQGNLIEGNYIGTDAAGSAATTNLKSLQGIWLEGYVRGTTIGGTSAGTGNIISGWNQDVLIRSDWPGDCTGNAVQGNYIGTNVSGSAALSGPSNSGNGGPTGIVLDASDNMVGGTAAGAGNLLSGLNSALDVAGDSNVIEGNLIGPDASGTGALANGGPGISLGGSNNTVGGSSLNAANTIAYNVGSGVAVGGTDNTIEGNCIHDNGGPGVWVLGDSGPTPPATGVQILGNSIHDNAGPGIGLGDTPVDGSGNPTSDPNFIDHLVPAGVVANTPGGPHTGANDLQNYPVLTSATTTATSTTITGTFNSVPGTTFRLEFFANPAADPSGYGQGKNYLGYATVTTDTNGNVSFTITLPAPLPTDESYVTATAINQSTSPTTGAGDTSEFSQCLLTGPSSGGSYTIREGDSLTLSAAPPPGTAPWTYAWSINGHANAAAGLNPTLTWSQLEAFGVNDGPGTYTVQAQATDSSGTTTTLPAATLTVTNAAPAAVIVTGLPTNAAGNPTSPEGNSITLTGSATDPSSADTSAGLSYSWTVVKHPSPASQGAGLVHITQYASRVLGFSSQSGNRFSGDATDWSAAQALGAPDVNAYRDDPRAWAPVAENGTQEYLSLGFNTPVYADGMTVWENIGNGFVTSVDLLDTTGTWHDAVWSGTDPTQPGSEAAFQISWAPTSYLVQGVRMNVNTNNNLGTWEEIDAVQLSGSYDSTGPINQYAGQALGDPNSPSLGSPESWSVGTHTGPSIPLAVSFAVPVYADGATIEETQGNGFVTEVDALDTNGQYHTVWTGTDPTQPGATADFQVHWPETTYQVTGLRVYVDPSRSTSTYQELLDSIQLHGWVNAGNVFASGNTTDLAFTPADDGTYIATLTATDQDGAAGTAQTTIDVTNVPPTVQLTQPSITSSGLVGLTLTASDPSTVDQAAGFTYTIDWGDGSAVQTVGPTGNNGAGVPVSHNYTAAGIYTVSATATDEDGSVSSGANAVVVLSSQVGDTISIAGGGSPGQVTITTADEVNPSSPITAEQVLVAGSGGTDAYTVNFGSTLTTTITLTGGGSSSGDTLTVNGDNSSTNVITKTPGQVTWGSPVTETVYRSGIPKTTINANGTSQNYINDPGGNTVINGGPGTNTFTITASSGNGVVLNGGPGTNTYVLDLGSLAGPLTINNSHTTASNTVVVNGAVGDNTITLSGSQVIAGSQTITLNAPLASAAINGGSGNNQITVANLTVPVQSLSLTGGGGNNTFILVNAGQDVGALTITGGSGSGTNQVQVQGSLPANVTAPHLAPVVSAGTAVTLDEGSTFSRSGSFIDSDAGASFTATVDYGDGTGAQALALNADHTFTLSHVYAAGGTFTVTVKVNDGEGDTGSTSFVATVLPSIYVLNSTIAGSLSLSGNASIQVAGLVDVDSSASAALSVGGNAAVKAGTIQVVGGAQVSSTASLSPKPATGAAAMADPLAALPVPSSGTVQGAVNLSGTASLTINPGVYGQIKVSGSAHLTLNPGVYVLAGGGLTVTGSGSLSGNGVLIYNSGSNYPSAGGSYGGVTLSGSGIISLTAGGGPDAGVVLFQARDNTRAIALGGNAAAGIGGTVYAPAALLTVGSNASVGGSLVVNRLQLTGNGSSTLVTGDGSGTDASVGELVAGDLALYVDNSGGSLTPDELGRIDDAVAAYNALLSPYGVAIAEVSSPDQANVVLSVGTTSPCGGQAAGVLGCYAPGAITLIQGWNYYAGADPAGIGASQYDFEALVLHELGHALGLGGSPDPGSVMYETLATGVIRRTPTTADLNIGDADGRPDAERAALVPTLTPVHSLTENGPALPGIPANRPKIGGPPGDPANRTVPILAEVADVAPEGVPLNRLAAGAAPVGWPAAAAGVSLPTLPTALVVRAPQPVLSGTAVPPGDSGPDADIVPAPSTPGDCSSSDGREPAEQVPPRDGRHAPLPAAVDAVFVAAMRWADGPFRPGTDDGQAAGGAVLFALLGALWGARSEEADSGGHRRWRG